MPKSLQRSSPSLGAILIALSLVIGGHVALLVPSLYSTTAQWDEYADLVIAAELSEHPLSGHTWDGSQARLPMYVTAVAYKLN